MLIERYLLLIISLAGLTLTVGNRFSKKEIADFLDYIVRLHNAIRNKHNILPLTRTKEMDKIASEKMDIYEIDMNNETSGLIFNWVYLNDTTKLDVAEAIKYFSLSYELGNFYDYEREPDNHLADEFTQIVWRSTTQIGITFRCQADRYNVLAVYDPPGNTLGEYKLNVIRPINRRPAIVHGINGLIYQTEPEKFLDYIVKLHNVVRRHHGVQPLQRNDYLDKLANSMLWGWRIRTRGRPGMIRLKGTYDRFFKLNAEKATELFLIWYNQKQYYSYSDGPLYTNNTEDFTQIVWNNTHSIGIDIKMTFDEYEIIVLYEPRGNIPRQYVSNVFEPQSMDQGESSGNN